MAMAAQKFGLGLLFNLSEPMRAVIAQLLVLALLPQERWSPELKAVVDAMPRRDQRQLLRLGVQYREGGGSGRTLVEEASVWLSSSERLIVRTALLITEDLVSTGRAVLLRSGMSPDCYEEGGLLVEPELQELCQYFVSDDYSRQRGWLVSSLGTGHLNRGAIPLIGTRIIASAWED